MKAELLIINGHCFNPTDEKTYEWVAISESKIIGIGFGSDYRLFQDACTETIDAKGVSVFPGFYDSHMQLSQTAFNLEAIDLSTVTSYEQIEKLVRIYADKYPGKLIRGVHLDERLLHEKKYPNRNVLDNICDSAPIWLTGVDSHTSMLNTYALLFFKIPYTIPGIELDGNCLPTGIFVKYANALLREIIFNQVDDKNKMKILNVFMKELVKQGVTTAIAMEGGFMFNDNDANFIHKNQKAFLTDICLFYQTSNIQKIKEMGLNRIGYESFVDGTIISRTAALNSNYSDDISGKGMLYCTEESLKSFLLECYRNDLQTALHVIGDQAIELAIKAHEYAFEQTGNNTLRHRLEHVILPTLKQIERSKALNLIYSMQPAYEDYWGGGGNTYSIRIGERYKRAHPFRTIIENGVIICGGSDSDVTPANPILGISAALNHPIMEQRAKLTEAIQMFTINAAYAVFEDDIKGSLDIGKQADIVILSKDLFAIPIDAIKDVTVAVTIKSGLATINTNNFGNGD